jgi:ribonuclease HII
LWLHSAVNVVIETIAGIDEAGRGPLAGPVVAAVVLLHRSQRIEGVRDSKQLTAAQRATAAGRIRAEALEWAVGEASREEIDELNILQATLLAMQRAFAGLSGAPLRVEVDGNRAPSLAGYAGIIETVVGGDRLRPAIAAASILAKVHRDGVMGRLHLTYPAYGFDRHKGYPTLEHRTALVALGPCPAHRRSFGPVRAAMPAGPFPTCPAPARTHRP